MQRYNWDTFNGEPVSFDDDDGEWVRYSDADAELSALRERVAELQGYGSLDVTVIASAIGCCESETILAAAQRLRASLATLEAPPIVPRGVSIAKRDDDPGSWDWEFDEPSQSEVTLQQWPTVYRAIAWAIEHDQRPPHASDEGKP